MGLAIEVGVRTECRHGDSEAAEQFECDLELIDEKLRERGLPEHQEPESLDPPPESRASITSFPFSWLHHLRRFAAHVMRDPKWVPYPVEPGEDPAEDPVLQQMYRRMDSHLLCHSDRQGYYIPVDFEELILDPDHEISGGIVGSSQKLREELLALVEHLEIDVDDSGQLPDDVAEEIAKQRPTGVPFAVERLVWLALWEAARISIERDTAVVFS